MEKANAVQVSTIKKRNYSTTWKRSRKNQHTTSLYNKATKTFPIHAAVRRAQSELFFRLLLKNTVCSPQITAYANFLRGFLREFPNKSSQNFIYQKKFMLIYVGSYSFLLAFDIFILTELNIVSWIILVLKTTDKL